MELSKDQNVLFGYQSKDSSFRKYFNVRSESETLLQKIFTKKDSMTPKKLFDNWSIFSNQEKTLQNFIKFFTSNYQKGKIYINYINKDKEYVINLDKLDDPKLYKNLSTTEKKYIDYIRISSEFGDLFSLDTYLDDLKNAGGAKDLLFWDSYLKNLIKKKYLNKFKKI